MVYMSQKHDSMPSIDESDDEEEDKLQSNRPMNKRNQSGTLKNEVDGVNIKDDDDIDLCDKNATLSLPLKISVEDILTDKFGFMCGLQYTEPSNEQAVPIEVTRSRERKWADMLNKWDDYRVKRRRKLTLRCRKGIPQSMRCKAWQCLCSSPSMGAVFQERFYYKEQLRPPKKADSTFRNSAVTINGGSDGDSVSVSSFYSVTPSIKSNWSSRSVTNYNHGMYDNYKKCTPAGDVVEQIRKDIDRQFPNHDFFMIKGGMGQESLSSLLTVYSVRHPETGYCQGMAPLAAALLMVMPEENAFWTFDRICELYIPGYYDDGLKQIQSDAKALNNLLKKENSAVYSQMRQYQIDPILYMVDWFMCIYIRTLPWPSVLQVMDMFLSEGKVILFKVALVLIIGSVNMYHRVGEEQQDTDILTLLRKLPDEITTVKYLTTNMARLSVTKTDIKREVHKQEKSSREPDSKASAWR